MDGSKPREGLPEKQTGTNVVMTLPSHRRRQRQLNQRQHHHLQRPQRRQRRRQLYILYQFRRHLETFVLSSVALLRLARCSFFRLFKVTAL